MTNPPAHLAANVERFMGFAERYDAFRPRPPAVLVDILTQLARTPRPALVVDLGSGTGLSTLLWAGHAERVVGVEPSADMRHQAEMRAAALPAPNVEFRHGYGLAIGLPGACADIVTCSQSLHWMEPAPTFAEVARILRPGGVFAAYDCDWPPTFDWEAEQAYKLCLAHALIAEQARGLSTNVHAWDKREHLERMRASGHFRFTKEILVHHAERGGAERLIGVALSQGQLATLLKSGATEDEIGITELRAAATRALGDATVPWHWSYRVRVGIV
jgi:ubiquinone/menaquinone biosynthesis C-methylase UbiE